jgi:hypothetical protein
LSHRHHNSTARNSTLDNISNGTNHGDDWVENVELFSTKVWCYIIGALALSISLGRSIKSLSKFTIVATIAMVIALVVIFTLTTSWGVHLQRHPVVISWDDASGKNHTTTDIFASRLWWPLTTIDIVRTGAHHFQELPPVHPAGLAAGCTI